jgi:hypothetical protein
VTQQSQRYQELSREEQVLQRIEKARARKLTPLIQKLHKSSNARVFYSSYAFLRLPNFHLLVPYYNQVIVRKGRFNK